MPVGLEEAKGPRPKEKGARAFRLLGFMSQVAGKGKRGAQVFDGRPLSSGEHPPECVRCCRASPVIAAMRGIILCVHRRMTTSRSGRK